MIVKYHPTTYVGLAESAYAADSKSAARKGVGVQVPCPTPFYLGVAQLVARLIWDQGVAGSSPVTQTIWHGSSVG